MQFNEQDPYFHNQALKRVNDAYSLCFLGLFLSYLTIIVAVIVAFLERPKVKNTYLLSHIDYILYGCLYYSLLLFGTIGIVIWNYQQSFFSQGNFFLGTFLYLLLFLPFIWWIRRFIRGLQYLKRNKAISNPKSLWRPK